MTIKDDLTPDVSAFTAEIVPEFGDLAQLRRQVEHRAADGSTEKLWRPVSGAEAPFPLVATLTDETMRREIWGKKVVADVTAIGLLSQATAIGDVLRFQEGNFAGIPFQVEARQPNSIGGITVMALKQVEPREEYGF